MRANAISRALPQAKPLGELMPGSETSLRTRLGCGVTAGAAARGLAVLLVMAMASPARSEGALWVGVPPDGLRNGFAYGYETRKATTDDAINSARQSCEEQAKKNGLDPGNCRQVATFKGRCVAVAMDPVNRWAGWSIAGTLEEARSGALAECAKGANACRVDNSACD